MSAEAQVATRPGHRSGARGSSMVEMLIVIAIMGVITTGLYSYFLATSRTYNDQAVNGRMLQNATSAMKRIIQDIRYGGTFLAPACAGIMPATVTATANPAGSVGIVTLLDDPDARTEIATTPSTGQPRSNTTIGVLVLSNSWQVNDIAYITDGVQCTKFTVTAVVTGANPGLTHVPANDTSTAGGGAYTYPVAGSMIYRVETNQTITYALDAQDPTWLTRTIGGVTRRFAPNIKSLSFSFLDGSGNAVNPATSAANVRAVTVDLWVKADTKDPNVPPDGYRTQRLTSTVQLRNFGS
ncbi:MAG: type II secretion system protein J [Candidatus Methylomirabilales bacterium]